jgi:hypothetical protein
MEFRRSQQQHANEAFLRAKIACSRDRRSAGRCTEKTARKTDLNVGLSLVSRL